MYWKLYMYIYGACMYIILCFWFGCCFIIFIVIVVRWVGVELAHAHRESHQSDDECLPQQEAQAPGRVALLQGVAHRHLLHVEHHSRHGKSCNFHRSWWVVIRCRVGSILHTLNANVSTSFLLIKLLCKCVYVYGDGSEEFSQTSLCFHVINSMVFCYLSRIHVQCMISIVIINCIVVSLLLDW